MGKAKQAAAELKILFDRQPAIDTWSEDGAKLSNVEGTIEFRDVHFRYPTRPEQPVLRGINILHSLAHLDAENRQLSRFWNGSMILLSVESTLMEKRSLA
jgi:ABC-type multidrug transport system fused ATPase/permease subunit